MFNFPETHVIQGVYYMASENPDMNPIAIRPQFTSPDYVSWEDTSNGRIVHAAKVLIDGKDVKELNNLAPDYLPEKIEVISDKGKVYTLAKLTKQVFDEKLKQYVVSGEILKFKDDADLQKFYLTGDFYTVPPDVEKK